MRGPYKTSKRQRQAAYRQYDRAREARGLPPLDRNPIPDATFCLGCPWAEDRCLRPQGPCDHSPIGPSDDCRARYATAAGDPAHCTFFRRGCRRRVCDCPYWPHETWTCQGCGDEAPHADIAFIQNRGRGLEEVKRRGYGFSRPSLVLCRQCLLALQQSSNKDVEFLAKHLMPNWSPAKTAEEKKAAKREYMRGYMRKRRAR